MARIRSIHPGLASDECYMSMSMPAKAAWPMLWTECDDHGVFEWKPIVLKARIFPADNIDFAGLLAEFVELGCVMKAEVGGKPYGFIRNFCKYQRPKSPTYRHPFPECARSFVGDSGTATEELPQTFPMPTEIAPLMKGEGVKEEGKTLPETKSPTPNVRSVGKPTRPAVDEFQDRFWKAYPSRGDASNPKAPALEKFAKAVKGGADPEAIIAAAQRYAEVERKAGRLGTEKVAQALTWLNQRRWGDYAAAAPASESQSSLVFVPVGSEAFDAWNAHKGKKHPFKYYPEHGGEGWLFPTEFPPASQFDQWEGRAA